MILQDLFAYLKAVFIESQRYMFTIFNILGLGLFLFPQLAQQLSINEVLARTIGGIMFASSFLIANFDLYRKLIHQIEVSGTNSFLIYPYQFHPYNAVELRYLGTRTLKDLIVTLNYKNASGQQTQTRITEFFPENDKDLLFNQFQ